MLILLIVFFSIFGEKGLAHLFRLNKELQMIEKYNENLINENLKLKKEISILKNEEDPRYLKFIEKIAREELGWAEEDELIYQFPN